MYAEHRAYETFIHAIAWPHCHHSMRHIGSDLLEHGVFIWNNRFGFAREVFDGFLFQTKHSEPSFVAYFSSTVDSYITHASPVPFTSDSSFRRNYFAFVCVCALESGMLYPHKGCGTKPRDLSADGTDMGYGIKALTAQFTPPTLSNARSPPTRTSSTFKRSRSLPRTPGSATRIRTGTERPWGSG